MTWWLRTRSTTLTITSKRILLRQGTFNKQTTEVPHADVANLQVRPEFRWDHSGAAGAFNGHTDQYTLGVGVAYLY